MPQNTSNAVMASRVEAPDSLDYFPTPPWATRALCEHLVSAGCYVSACTVAEPACGAGHMARPLEEYFNSVYPSDVFDYGYGDVRDFLWPDDGTKFDWTITNPPFLLGDQFALTALERSRRGVAMFVRTQFLESEGRLSRLFEPYRPSAILQFSERVMLFKGVVRQPGVRYLDTATGKMKLPSSATAYCWIVWEPLNNWCADFTRFHWISPCRRQLERPGDYD